MGIGIPRQLFLNLAFLFVLTLFIGEYFFFLSHVLQCGAVCCSVLQCVAVCCSVLQCAAVCCSVLQCVAVCFSHYYFVFRFARTLSPCGRNPFTQIIFCCFHLGRDPFSRNVTKPTPRRKWYLMTGRRFEFVFLLEASWCIKANWGLHPRHYTHMPSSCACRCGRRVDCVGNFHKACRLRITVAGGVCKPNVRSAVAKRRHDKHNLANSAKNNAIKNPINNPVSSKKRKLDRLARRCKTTRLWIKLSR